MKLDESGTGEAGAGVDKDARPAPLSLLVADHSPAMRDNLARLATVLSMDLCGMAENGREAVDLCLRHRPDLVLLDILMPGLPGIEILNEIRRELPATRVIVLTTESERERVMDFKRLGAAGYVLKPFDWDFLKDKVIQVARLAGKAGAAGEARYGVMNPGKPGARPEVARFCLSCGSLNPLDHRFCGYCGHALAAPPLAPVQEMVLPDSEAGDSYFRRLLAETRLDKALFLKALSILTQPDIEEIFHEQFPIE